MAKGTAASTGANKHMLGKSELNNRMLDKPSTYKDSTVLSRDSSQRDS